MLNGLTGIMQAMKQAQAIQGRMGEIQSKLADVRVEGSAGGGMVTATADGQQRLISCRIEAALADSGDREMLEDLICSAVNQALDKSREAVSGEMSSMMEGLDMPAIKDALSGFPFPGSGS